MRWKFLTLFLLRGLLPRRLPFYMSHTRNKRIHLTAGHLEVVGKWKSPESQVEFAHTVLVYEKFVSSPDVFTDSNGHSAPCENPQDAWGASFGCGAGL